MSEIGFFAKIFQQGLTPRPWTDIDRTSQDLWNEILDTIERSLKGTSVQILLVGATQSGKSSFINSIKSIAEGRIANIACASGSATSCTSQLSIYCGVDSILTGISLVDIPGIEESDKCCILIDDVKEVIQGHVKHAYKFSDSPIHESSEFYRSDPQFKDKIQCVVFVFDALIFTKDIPAKLICKFKDLHEIVKESGLTTAVVLTKIDKLCPWIESNASYTFRSKKLKDVIERVVKLIGVQERYIYPVINLIKMEKSYEHKRRLLLLAWMNIIHFTADYVEQVKIRRELERS